MRSTILCVDDEKLVLNVLSEQLSSWFGKNYNIEKAMSGEEALEVIDSCVENNQDISVVISDYIMPGMKGDILLEKINKKNPRIKKIMLTGYSSMEGIISAINRASLYRYITKPWDNNDLMLTLLEAIKSYEQEKKAEDLSKGFEQLYHQYEERSRAFESNYESVLEALAAAIETRTAAYGHSKRVAQYADLMGKALNMPEAEFKALHYMALLHDVGKLGMKDDRLEMLEALKTGQKSNDILTKEQIQSSEQIISHINQSDMLLAGIKYQFEEYDGSGPFRMVGEEIPLPARIIHLVEYFDLLANNSANKSPLNDILTLMQKGKFKFFDPKLVDLFSNINWMNA